MELAMDNGDYRPDAMGGFRRREGSQAILARALFLLTARRGAFPFLPEVGSRLYLLAGEKPSSRDAVAAQYAQEALDALGVQVLGASVTATDEKNARVTVRLALDGQSGTVEVTV